MEYVENVMNLEQEVIGVNLVILKDLRITLKIGLVEIKFIDEFIQQSQLDAVYCETYLEWVPFENFKDVTYITKGGFGKIYSAIWPDGAITSWDIENQQWERDTNEKIALKSLDNSADICADFFNEVKSHLQIPLYDIIKCHGITQDPNTKDYMMVLQYCNHGNLRNYYLNESNTYNKKIYYLFQIIRGLLDIHNSGKVHKDFHSGNVLSDGSFIYISDLGMCQPVNGEQSVNKEAIYGVLPYMAPEVLRGHQYTKASDIYSFGIIMNEYLPPYNDIPHDHVLANDICKGLRPKISEDTPKLFADLITKCWDAKAENRPTAKELFQLLIKLNKEKKNENSEIYSQIKECEKIRENKLKDKSCEKKSNNIQTHSQAIYTSRLLNFKNLPEPVNAGNLI
ncbi:kinase-like domain-containing protein [Glomus cerebriforme]|uniref:Kinase-like domain-containing protein n=1 Tax=Glomus cerebriforme TaxID=658196 RepID=A0A397S9D8_9GLOM|nr:kinase-like domain-containing protein [Glomus cerebriforme]